MIWSFCLTLIMLTSLYRQMFLFLLMHKILFSSFSNCAGERDQVYTNFLSSCRSSAAIKITQKGTYNRYSEIQFQFSFYDAHVIYNRKKCIQWIFILNVWVCLLKLIFFFFVHAKCFDVFCFSQADLINQLYQGKLKDYVRCLECGYESWRIDTYLDIPLVIRPFGASQVFGSVVRPAIIMTSFCSCILADGVLHH